MLHDVLAAVGGGFKEICFMVLFPLLEEMNQFEEYFWIENRKVVNNSWIYRGMQYKWEIQ